MAEDSKFMERTSLNAAINIARTVVTALIGIFMVPFYIDTLGVATYGLIPLATAMSSYIMIISDSLVSACYRYVMTSFREDDPDSISVTYNTSLYGIGKAQLVLIPIVLVFAFVSPYLFNISGTAVLDVQVMFCLILLSTLIVTYCSAMNSIFYAVNKLYILYSIRIFYIVSQVAIILVLFHVTAPSLIEVGLAYLLSAVLFYILIRYYSRRIYPGLKVDRRLYDAKLFRNIGSLGLWTVLRKLGDLLFIQISLIMVNLYLGPIAGGNFAIVVNMISMLNTACFSITAVISPLLYHAQKDSDPNVLIDVTCSYLKIMSLICAVPIAFVMVFCPQILTAWVGGEYVDLAPLVAIAYLAELLYVAHSLISDITIMYLKVKEACVMTLAFGVMNILLGSVLAVVFDLDSMGIIVAWTVSTVLLCAAITMYSSRLIGASAFKCMVPVLEGYAVMAVCYVVLYSLSDIMDVGYDWISIILWLIVVFAIYVPFMIKLMNRRDRAETLRMMPSFGKKVFNVLFRYL